MEGESAPNRIVTSVTMSTSSPTSCSARSAMAPKPHLSMNEPMTETLPETGDDLFAGQPVRCRQTGNAGADDGDLHGRLPTAGLLISGSERYAETTKPKGFSSRSFSLPMISRNWR